MHDPWLKDVGLDWWRNIEPEYAEKAVEEQTAALDDGNWSVGLGDFPEWTFDSHVDWPLSAYRQGHVVVVVAVVVVAEEEFAVD